MALPSSIGLPAPTERRYRVTKQTLQAKFTIPAKRSTISRVENTIQANTGMIAESAPAPLLRYLVTVFYAVTA